MNGHLYVLAKGKSYELLLKFFQNEENCKSNKDSLKGQFSCYFKNKWQTCTKEVIIHSKESLIIQDKEVHRCAIKHHFWKSRDIFKSFFQPFNFILLRNFKVVVICQEWFYASKCWTKLRISRRKSFLVIKFYFSVTELYFFPRAYVWCRTQNKHKCGLKKGTWVYNYKAKIFVYNEMFQFTINMVRWK